MQQMHHTNVTLQGGHNGVDATLATYIQHTTSTSSNQHCSDLKEIGKKKRKQQKEEYYP